MFKRFFLLLAVLALWIGAAAAEGLTAPPLWLSEVPNVPEKPESIAFTYEDGLLLVEDADAVRHVSMEYLTINSAGEIIAYSYEADYDETRGGWYSEEAAADPEEPYDILIETDAMSLRSYDGSIEDLTLLENGEARYMWTYWLEPFEGVSMWDAPFNDLVIYPSADWPMETMYSGYDVLVQYTYTAADGARVRYEAHGLIWIMLEKDGKRYAYTPSGGSYPAGWSVYTGDTSAHASGYTPCDAPEGVYEEDYIPLIDQEVWLKATQEAFRNR